MKVVRFLSNFLLVGLGLSEQVVIFNQNEFDRYSGDFVCYFILPYIFALAPVHL